MNFEFGLKTKKEGKAHRKKKVLNKKTNKEGTQPVLWGVGEDFLLVCQLQACEFRSSPAVFS